MKCEDPISIYEKRHHFFLPYMNEQEDILWDEESFLKMLNMLMPFGKYKGMRLIDLPEDYVMWFARKGFPSGKLGDMLKCIYEIQLNGLDHSLDLRRKSRR